MLNPNEKPLVSLNGTPHGSRFRDASDCFNTVPSANPAFVTNEQKDAYVAKTMERIADVYADVHGRKS